MVAGKHRSGSLRKVFVKAPGGNVKEHYRRRKPSATKCSCGAKLKGVPRGIPSEIKKLSKSQKKPERPFGGNLCTKCARVKIKELHSE